MPQLTVFFSHIHEESRLATLLHDAIHEDFLGMAKLFLDDVDILPGTLWQKSIRNAIATGGPVLMCVLCSRESLNRPWINMEIGAAWGVGSVVIVPILHAGLSASELPKPISDFAALDATMPEGLMRLYETIQSKLECPVGPPKSRIYNLHHKILDFEDAYSKVRMQPQRYAASLWEPAGGEYRRMLDGTVKQLNPITGTVA